MPKSTVSCTPPFHREQMMALRLIVEMSNQSVSHYTYHFDQPEVRVGRFAGIDVQLPFATVSGHHFSIHQSPAGYELEDMQSTNGVLLNQKPVAPRTRTLLQNNDTIQLMDVILHVSFPNSDEIELSTMEQSEDLARKMVSAYLHKNAHGEEKASLEVLEGPDRGTRALLPFEKPFHIGDGGELSLLDPAFRGVRAVIQPAEGGYRLELPANLACSIDGKSLKPGSAHVLQSGHRIRMGGSTMLFVDPLQKYINELQEEPGEVSQTGKIQAQPSKSWAAWEMGLLAAVVVVGLSALVALVLLIAG